MDETIKHYLDLETKIIVHRFDKVRSRERRIPKNSTYENEAETKIRKFFEYLGYEVNKCNICYYPDFHIQSKLKDNKEKLRQSLWVEVKSPGEGLSLKQIRKCMYLVNDKQIVYIAYCIDNNEIIFQKFGYVSTRWVGDRFGV